MRTLKHRVHRSLRLDFPLLGAFALGTLAMLLAGCSLQLGGSPATTSSSQLPLPVAASAAPSVRPATTPATTHSATVATPSPTPIATATADVADTEMATMLETATPDLLSCIDQGGQACMSAVLELDGACGGAIPEIGCTAGMRADGLSAHDLARELFDGASVASTGPALHAAVNRLRADMGLPPLSS